MAVLHIVTCRAFLGKELANTFPRQTAFNVSHGRFACGFSYTLHSTLKMEAIRYSETSVNITATRCHIPEDCFLQI
jgi:hypothetical protein